MNYGYSKDVPGYKPERQEQLAAALRELVEAFNKDHQRGPEQRGPYVEVDEFYQGVRIRRITNMSDEGQQSLVKLADEVYRQVMGVRLAPEPPQRPKFTGKFFKIFYLGVPDEKVVYAVHAQTEEGASIRLAEKLIARLPDSPVSGSVWMLKELFGFCFMTEDAAKNSGKRINDDLLEKNL